MRNKKYPEINNTFIEQSETLFQIADFIFGDLYSENKYRYSARYNFDFNKIVDDRYYKMCKQMI